MRVVETAGLVLHDAAPCSGDAGGIARFWSAELDDDVRQFGGMHLELRSIVVLAREVHDDAHREQKKPQTLITGRGLLP